MTSKIRDLIKKLKNIRRKNDDLTFEEDHAEVEFDSEEPVADSDSEEPVAASDSEVPEDVPPLEEGMVEGEEFTGTKEFPHSEEGLDLGQPPTFQEKLSEKTRSFTRNFKDKLNKIDIRKFKPFRADSSGTKDKAPTPSPLSKIDKKFDLGRVANFPLEIFHPKKRNAIHKGFQLAIIFGTVFAAGKNLALFLKGPDGNQGLNKTISASPFSEEKQMTMSEVNQIKNSGLFKTEAAKPDTEEKKPVIQQNVICKTADRQSRLPIKLLNTVVLQDSVKSIASVQVRSNELTEVREGDKINNMAKIDLIDRQKIIVKNLQDGMCEIIANDPEGASPRSSIAVMSPAQSKAFKKRSEKIEGIENEGNKYTIEKSFIKDKMKNISDVLTQARGIQMTNPDGTLSFKIVDVQPGGIFSYLGIQNNDVITKINGKKISNLNEVMSLFGKISNVDKMKITVNRNGEEVPLDYNIQ